MFLSLKGKNLDAGLVISPQLMHHLWLCIQAAQGNAVSSPANKLYITPSTVGKPPPLISYLPLTQFALSFIYQPGKSAERWNSRSRLRVAAKPQRTVAEGVIVSFSLLEWTMLTGKVLSFSSCLALYMISANHRPPTATLSYTFREPSFFLCIPFRANFSSSVWLDLLWRM